MDRRRLLRLAAVLGTAGLTAACAEPLDDTPDNSATRWNKGRIAIATGGTSGVYYQFGGALADAINASLPGAVATHQPSGASADNVGRIMRGDAALGLSGDGVPADAFNGAGAFTDNKQSVVALASVFPGILHLVVRNDLGTDFVTGAPIPRVENVSQLAGLRISRGVAGSGDDTFSRRVLETAGFDIDKDVQAQNMPITDAIPALKRSRDSEDAIDALFASSGVPNSSIAKLLAGGQYHLVPLGSVADQMQNKFGGYRPSTIPGEAYGIDDLASVEAPTLLLSSPDLPEDLAYDITKAFFDHQAEITELVPAVGDVNTITATDTAPVPLHPGAARYYQEHQ